MRPEIRLARLEDCEALATQLRPRDLATAKGFGLDATLMLKWGVRNSAEAWLGLGDGQPLCMIGVDNPNMLTGEANLWFVGTENIQGFTFARESYKFIEYLKGRYSALYGHVDVTFEKSIRWLVWLGFSIGDETMKATTLVRRFHLEAR